MTDDPVKLFKALGNPTRLGLIRRLAINNTDRSRSGLATELLSQPTMSYHFIKLVEAGLISEKKLGSRKRYQLNHRRLLVHGVNPDKL